MSGEHGERCGGENCLEHEANNVRIANLVSQIKEYSVNQREIVQILQDVRERVTAADASTRSAHHRLDEMSEQTKAIIRMSVSVEHVAEKMNDVLTILKEHGERMDGQDKEIQTLKRAPAEAVMAYWKMFVGALVVGAAGIVLGWLASKGVVII